MPGKNQVRDLALFFIREILGRKVYPADFGGRHFATAKRLLKTMKYDYDAIIAALVALRDRDYTQFGYNSEKQLPSRLDGMEVLYKWGEPPLIERFLSPPPIPPVYSCDYRKWVRRWGKTAIKRGEWDGLYRQNPEPEQAWLIDVIGKRRYQRSMRLWRTLQNPSPQKKQSSG